MEKERERIRGDLDSKLERERDKELRKYKLETSKLNDRKDELLKTHHQALKEQKRNLEKTIQEDSRAARIKEDLDFEKDKDQIRARVV